MAVLGADPFGPFLREAAAGKQVAGHPLEVRAATSAREAAAAHLVYVSASERGRLSALLKDLEAAQVLTVGDSDGYGAAGVMVNLYLDERRVRFEVNQRRVARARAEAERADARRGAPRRGLVVMLRALRRSSIRLQVLLPLVLVTHTGFLVASGAFLWLQDRAIRAALVSEATALGDVTAANCRGALTFGDEINASSTLASLAHHPTSCTAALYAPNGAGVRHVRRAETAVELPPGTGARSRFLDAASWSSRPRSSSSDERAARHRSVIETSTARVSRPPPDRADARRRVLLAAVAAGRSACWRGGSTVRVARPIVGLAEAAAAISRDRDYSRRVQSRLENEVGDLFGAFNDMLSQIQARDDELQEHRAHLTSRWTSARANCAPRS